MTLLSCRSALAALLFLGILTARAQTTNWVPNPDFSDGLNQWTPSCYEAAAVSDASDGSPSPPSLQFFADYLNPGIGLACAVSACIALSPPQAIDWFANVEIGAASLARISVEAYSDANCLTPAENIGNADVMSAGAWQTVSQAGIALPANSNSVNFILTVAPDPSGKLNVHFDHIRLGPAGSTPVRLQSFDVK